MVKTLPTKFFIWRYKNHKELYQIAKNHLEDFQHQQQLEWIADATKGENNDVMYMLTFYITLNKRLGRKLQSILTKG